MPKKAAAAKAATKPTATKPVAAKRGPRTRGPALGTSVDDPSAIPSRAPVEPSQPVLFLTAADLPVARLFPSPLNPRRSMDPAKLEELADSIAQNGVLQSLLVRPAPTTDGEPQRYEIACGARRWTAAKSALEMGRVPADFTVPVRIRNMTDAELVELAATENLSRDDMHPLDEAAVFEALRKVIAPGEGETPEAAVGRRLGVSERTVFRRLALLRLAPDLQTALRDGEINLQQASAFSLGTPDGQVKLWRRSKRDGWSLDPQTLRRAMTETRIPADRALFDPATYDGEIVIDPDDGQRYFADAPLFDKLQAEAVEAKLEALRKKWPWAERLPKGTGYWEYAKAGAKPKDPDAGAILYFDHAGRCEVLENVLKPETLRARRAAEAAKERAARGVPAKEEKFLTDAQAIAAKHTKTRAMRRAVSDHPKAGVVLTILGLLRVDEVRIRTDGFYGPENVIEATLFDRTRLEQLLEPVFLALKDPETDECPGLDDIDPLGIRDDDEQAAAFAALMALEVDELLRIQAALIAERIGSWWSYGARLGDTPLSIAIAAVTGAEAHLAELWQPGEDYFKAYSREMLQRLAIANGLGEGFAKVKKGEMVARLASQPAGFWTAAKFTELRFLREEAMREALEGPAPFVRDEEDWRAAP